MAGQLVALLLASLLRAPVALSLIRHDVSTTHKPSEKVLDDPSEKFRQELRNYHDLQYYGEITMGGQRLQSIMDTGSIELVVISEKCHYWCGMQHPLYKPSKSKDYHEGTLGVVLTYGSGDLLGNEAYDSLEIGPYTAHKQPFWEVTDANMALLFDASFEAIVGLGPLVQSVNSMIPGASQNNLNYAVALKNLHISRYSICMLPDPGAPGYLMWQDDTIDLHPTYFTRINLVNSGFWLIQLTDVMIGNKRIACFDGCGAIIDSGTSLLALPDNAYKRMVKVIDHMGSNCMDLYNLPNLNFKLGGLSFSLPPDSYMGKIDGKVPKSMVSHFTRLGNASCQHALMHVAMRSSLGSIWILGMPFFRTYYTVFVQGRNPKIYAAQASRDCTPSSMNGTQDDYDNSTLQKLFPERRNRARIINVTELWLPNWVRTAVSLGYLPETTSNNSGRNVTQRKLLPSFHPPVK